MLYLASQSPRRRMLMRRLGRPFQVVHSICRETIRREASPEANAMRNARNKARRALLPKGAAGLVIGADTFVYFRGRVIGKPRTRRKAVRLLLALSGSSHWVYTGLCLLNAETGQARTAYEKTKVTFNRLTPETVERVLARTSPLDKAGGYAVQEDRGELIARIDGSSSNVIGLPLELLRCELRALERAAR